MKASELIKKLEDAIEKVGDHEVMMHAGKTWRVVSYVSYTEASQAIHWKPSIDLMP